MLTSDQACLNWATSTLCMRTWNTDFPSWELVIDESTMWCSNSFPWSVKIRAKIWSRGRSRWNGYSTIRVILVRCQLQANDFKLNLADVFHHSDLVWALHSGSPLPISCEIMRFLHSGAAKGRFQSLCTNLSSPSPPRVPTQSACSFQPMFPPALPLVLSAVREQALQRHFKWMHVSDWQMESFIASFDLLSQAFWRSDPPTQELPVL